MRSAFLSTCLALATLGACRTTTDDAPVGLAQSAPVVLELQHMWRVMQNEEVAGVVVRFGSADAASDATKHYYSVRNALQQELGAIDGHGRAWRFEPHQETPRFLGTGSVLEGARSILALDGHVELVEAPLAPART